MIKAKDVEDGGVQIVDMHFVVLSAQPDGIGTAVSHAAFHGTTREDNTVPPRIMVPASTLLAHGHAPEFATPNNERILPKPPCLQITEKTGMVAAVVGVADEDELIAITSGGIMIRTTVGEISLLGRSTQGVRVININTEEGEAVASIARIVDPTTNGEGDAGAEIITDASEEPTSEEMPEEPEE